MKVVLVNTNSDIESGASRSLVILAKHLKNYCEKVLVVLPKKGSVEKLLQENDVAYAIIRHSNTLWFKECEEKKIKWKIKDLLRYLTNIIAKLRMFILFRTYDVVHINALTTGIAAEVAEYMNKVCIWHFREFMEEDLGIEFRNKRKAIKLIEAADCRIAISQEVKNKYIKLIKKPINVIYNGVQEEQYYLERNRAILQNDQISILIPGRISKYKGQKVLLQALQYLTDKIELKYILKVVGSGDEDYTNELKEYSENNFLNVEFVGYKKEMKAYYESADIVCICSRNEAFGRVVVEAMMAECLVIGANAGGIKEIIQNEKNGLLFEPENHIELANCLKNIIQNRQLGRKYAQQGQKDAIQLYSSKTNAKNVFNLYEQTLNERKM